MAQFAVDTTYVTDLSVRDAARPAHREYIRELSERGTVLAAGPWADDLGGFIVYEAADRAELDSLLAADPYTSGGAVAGRTVREWRVLFGSWLAG